MVEPIKHKSEEAEKKAKVKSDEEESPPASDVRISKRGGERGEMAPRESASALFDFDPFAVDPLKLLQNVMGLLDMGRARAVEQTALAPVEMFERGEELVVRADLPGMSKEDVSIEISNGCLLIEGERLEEEREEDVGFYRSERAYGTFRRAIALPDGVDADAAKAQFKDGVLEIVMPQKRTQSRRLQIEG